MSLTAQQSEINIARVALQALAAVLGGTQSLHTDAFDEALALPTEKAARIALRTQQIIAHETGVANVADPLGGAPYVEWMTDEMERRAEEVFAHLLDIGNGSMLEGVYAGIENGYFQGEIADAAYRFERQSTRPAHCRRRQRRLPTATTEAARPSTSPRRQKRSIEATGGGVKQRRDDRAVHDAARTSEAVAADPTANTMPVLIDAVRALATKAIRTCARRIVRHVRREGDRVMGAANHPREARLDGHDRGLKVVARGCCATRASK